MKIIVDVMGGDHAPQETVKGLIMAAKEYDASFVAVGNREDIERIAKEEQYDMHNIEIVHTDVVMTMVDGRILYENGEYLTLDKEKIIYEANAAAARLMA